MLHTFSREYIVEDLVDLMNKKGVADMHCLSDEYLAEELMIERNKQQ